jgi:hypothetical protein
LAQPACAALNAVLIPTAVALCPHFPPMQGRIFQAIPDYYGTANGFVQSVFLDGLTNPGELCGVVGNKLYYLSLDNTGASCMRCSCAAHEKRGGLHCPLRVPLVQPRVCSLAQYPMLLLCWPSHPPLSAASQPLTSPCPPNP